MLLLCVFLCLTPVFAKLKWLLKYHLKIIQINNEPFKDKYLLSNIPIDIHTRKKYDCGYQIAPNREKSRGGGGAPYLHQTAGAPNDEVRTDSAVCGWEELISGVMTQGATLGGVFPSPPTQPAFSSWAARNRKGARRKKAAWSRNKNIHSQMVWPWHMFPKGVGRGERFSGEKKETAAV